MHRIDHILRQGFRVFFHMGARDRQIHAEGAKTDSLLAPEDIHSWAEHSWVDLAIHDLQTNWVGLTAQQQLIPTLCDIKFANLQPFLMLGNRIVLLFDKVSKHFFGILIERESQIKKIIAAENTLELFKKMDEVL